MPVPFGTCCGVNWPTPIRPNPIHQCVEEVTVRSLGKGVRAPIARDSLESCCWSCAPVAPSVRQ